MFDMSMKTMGRMAAMVAACGLAASLLFGLPIRSMMRSAGDQMMTAAGPEMTASSVLDLIAASREGIAKATPAIERIKRQGEMLAREQAALDKDIPRMKGRLEQMIGTLDRAGAATKIEVNGREYPRAQVEADINAAMMEFERLQNRAARLPGEREALDRQVARLERERAEAWTRLAAMEREVGELESRGQVANATREASELSLRDASGLGRQMARLRDMVESSEAMSMTLGTGKEVTTIDWDGGASIRTKARELGLTLPGRDEKAAKESSDEPATNDGASVARGG